MLIKKTQINIDKYMVSREFKILLASWLGHGPKYWQLTFSPNNFHLFSEAELFVESSKIPLEGSEAADRICVDNIHLLNTGSYTNMAHDELLAFEIRSQY